MILRAYSGTRVERKELQIIGTVKTYNWDLPKGMDANSTRNHFKHINFAAHPELNFFTDEIKTDDSKHIFLGINAELFRAARDKAEEESRLRFFDKPAPAPIQRMASPFFTIYDSSKDLFHKRRVKTTLLKLAFMLGGAAVGLAAAAMITTIGISVIALGGTLGLTIFGAVIGQWVGKKVTQKFFKEERKYEPTTRDINNYTRDYKVSEAVFIKMNAYLRNKEQNINNDFVKNAFIFLRKKSLKSCDLEMNCRLNRFFINELKVLNEMKNKLENTPENIPENLEIINKNIKCLEEILEEFKNNEVPIDSKTKLLISEALDEISSTENIGSENDLTPIPPQTVDDNAIPLSPHSHPVRFTSTKSDSSLISNEEKVSRLFKQIKDNNLNSITINPEGNTDYAAQIISRAISEGIKIKVATQNFNPEQINEIKEKVIKLVKINQSPQKNSSSSHRNH